MTSLHSAYTPLESLLLFQALRFEGVQTVSFNRISDQLKSVPLIRNDPTFDSGRLSPDALRELYLGLLKDEVKRDLERRPNGENEHATINGDVSPGARKRKVASPSLPTVHEAAQHNHLIPQLVNRLYARYRDNVIRGLRENERRYGSLERDLAEIEAGKWDERLQRNKPVSARQSPKPSSVANTQPSHARAAVALPIRAESASPAPKQLVAENTSSQPARSPQTSIDAVANHGSDRPSTPDDHEKAHSNTALSSTSDTAPRSPGFGTPSQAHESTHPQQQHQSHPAQPITTTHVQTQSAGHRLPHQPHENDKSAHTANSSDPEIQPDVSQLPFSPLPILPPPLGTKVQSQPAHLPFSSGAQTAPTVPQQQSLIENRANPTPLPTLDYPSRAHVQQRMAPGAPGFHHHHNQQPQTPYVDHRVPFSQQLPQTPTYPARPVESNFTPSHPPSQDTTKGQPHIPPIHRQLSHAPKQWSTPHVSHMQNAPATEPRNFAHAPSPLVSDIVRALATPLRPRIGPLWKSEYRPASINVLTEPARPEIEPMSPTREPPQSPARSIRSTRSRDPRVTEETSQDAPAKTRPGRRRKNARAASPHSVISSIADESLRARTRSQSVSTVAGVTVASDDRPGSRNGVKLEPSTPANMLEDPESTPIPIVTPASGPRTRKRRGTLQAQAPPPSKRKMLDSPGMPENDQDIATSSPRRSNTVVAAKNFAKMSATVMNDINSHKHASYFATAVRDKNAPGYGKIVLQPQSLKSIRAAITAGTRAINSASSNLDSPTGTPAATTSRSFESSSVVELERTIDLIPPKAIVNGAQLEKELMRMFANAFMFNPGEDGMALITKEMFQDVQQTLNDWRGTEREVGIDEEDDGKGKRRKL